MGLDSLIRSVVKVVDNATTTAQPTVTHKVWKSQDIFGAGVFTDVKRKAVVEYRHEQVRTATGELSVSRAYLCFPRALTIALKDEFVLPDGSTARVLSLTGPVDRGTGKPFATEVWVA